MWNAMHHNTVYPFTHSSRSYLRADGVWLCWSWFLIIDVVVVGVCYAAVDVTLRFLASVDHCAYIVFNFLHVIFIDNHLPNRKRMNGATTTTPRHHRRYRIKLSTVGFLRLQFINIHTNIFKCNTTNKREEQRAGTDFDVKTQLHMQTNGRR